MVTVEVSESRHIGRNDLPRQGREHDELLDFATDVIAPGSHIRIDGARN